MQLTQLNAQALRAFKAEQSLQGSCGSAGPVLDFLCPLRAGLMAGRLCHQVPDTVADTDDGEACNGTNQRRVAAAFEMRQRFTELGEFSLGFIEHQLVSDEPAKITPNGVMCITKFL